MIKAREQVKVRLIKIDWLSQLFSVFNFTNMQNLRR